MVREGEESVDPVRAEGAGSRAAAQGRGRRARAIVEKGAGRGPALCAICDRPPPPCPPGVGGALAGLPCTGLISQGSPACGFGARQGGGVRSAFLCLPGLGLAGGAVRSGNATPPGDPPPSPWFPPPWQVRRGSGKPAVRSGWESRRLDLPRPMSRWVGGASRLRTMEVSGLSLVARPCLLPWARGPGARAVVSDLLHAI